MRDKWKWLSIPGAIFALIAAWMALGLPTPAWTTDIRRLDRQQVENAIQIYNDRVHSLLSVQPPTDPIANQNWQEQLRHAHTKQDQLEQRLLELSK